MTHTPFNTTSGTPDDYVAPLKYDNDLWEETQSLFAQHSKTVILMKTKVDIHVFLGVEKLFLWHATVKTLYTDTLYNSKILYNCSSFCTNVPLGQNFFIS